MTEPERCLLCGEVGDKAIVHQPSGVYICMKCRDNHINTDPRYAEAPAPAEYIGPCPKCGAQLGFGHLPEECKGKMLAPAPAKGELLCHCGHTKEQHSLNPPFFCIQRGCMCNDDTRTDLVLLCNSFYEQGLSDAASLREQLADSNLAFEHADEVVGKLEKDAEGLRERVKHLSFALTGNDRVLAECTPKQVDEAIASFQETARENVLEKNEGLREALRELVNLVRLLRHTPISEGVLKKAEQALAGRQS